MESGSIASLGWASGSDFYLGFQSTISRFESSRPSQTVRQPDPSFVMTGSQVRILFAAPTNSTIYPIFEDPTKPLVSANALPIRGIAYVR